MDDLSKEQDFYVTIVDVEEVDYNFFVQLSTNPVAVCSGIGDSMEKAKKNSSENALIYLQTMTK